MSLEKATSTVAEQYEIKLLHHRQQYNWDCGISCVLMVLPVDQRQFFIHNFQLICKEEGFCKSTWTIDLCHLLKRFSVDFIFYTTTLGIHPHHKQHNFYEKILQKDEERVVERFKNAKINGIKVRKKSLHTNDLVRHLRKHGPIILLANASYLQCECCKKNKIATDLFNYLPWVANYHGHYIVLCGYDLRKKRLYYRNPALSNRVCELDFTTLNKARLSYGTDEDCIWRGVFHLWKWEMIPILPLNSNNIDISFSNFTSVNSWSSSLSVFFNQSCMVNICEGSNVEEDFYDGIAKRQNEKSIYKLTEKNEAKNLEKASASTRACLNCYFKCSHQPKVLRIFVYVPVK